MSESPRKVQNVRQLTTKIRQEVFQKECFLLDLFTYVITSFDSLERMVTIMKRFYTAESVTEGHPDKLCDLIADSILDACLKEDENSRVACEVLATKGNIIVAGEITSRFEPQVFEIIKKVLESAGYEAEEIHMDALIHKQSPDIAGAVAVSYTHLVDDKTPVIEVIQKVTNEKLPEDTPSVSLSLIHISCPGIWRGCDR